MSFSDEVGDFREFAQARVKKIRQESALILFTSVIEDTPVDTGMLRANWIVTGQAPATHQVMGPIQPGSRTEIDTTLKSIRVGTKIFMVNNLPYAVPIEVGHGMVRKNKLRWRRIVNDVIARNQ